VAKKFYKNLTGVVLSIPLFGKGVLSIPANAESVELDESVAKAINSMVTVTVLEETTPKLTENPIAKKPVAVVAEEAPVDEKVATAPTKRRSPARKK